MSLEPKFIVSLNPDSLSIKFTDTTGDYDATTNPTGFGAPNPERADINLAELTITGPASDYSVGTGTVTIDLTTYNYPIETVFDIPIADVTFVSGAFVDGAYQFDLQLYEVGEEFIPAYSWTALFRNELKCCLDTLVGPYRPCKCKGKDVTFDSIQALILDLYAISKAEDCQLIPDGVDALSHGHEICDGTSNCKSCGC